MQLTAGEITQAETHSLKGLNKTRPGRPIVAQSGSPTVYTGKIIDVFLLPFIKKTEHMYWTARASYD